MRFTVDEHPVGALGSCRADPSFRVTGRPRGPWRGLDRLHAPAGEDRVEDAREVGVTVPDQETGGPVRSPRSMSRLRACWAVHPPSGWALTPRTCTRRVLTSMTNSADRRLRKIVPAWKKSQAIGLSAQERPPGGVHVPRRRPAPPGGQDPPRRRRTDAVTEPAQFAVHPAVPPGRVLPRRPQHQGADLRAGARPAWPVLVRPFGCDQTAMPGRQRTRRDQPAGAQHSWKQPGQRRQDRPVGPVRLGPGDLTAEYRDLITKHQDLRVLRCLAAG